MSIGKSSITKRVAKSATEEQNIAPELIATVATPKAETKKAPAKKTAAGTKKPAAKKTTTTDKTASTAAKKVDTAVIANISAETVAAVIGHEESKGFEKVQLGDKMPVHLL